MIHAITDLGPIIKFTGQAVSFTGPKIGDFVHE